MEWRAIRAAFIRRRGKRNQSEIAKAGKLPQSAISKIENNDDLGPTVGVFMKALDGLGVRPSVFFAEIEHGQKMSLPNPQSGAIDPTLGGEHGAAVQSSSEFTSKERRAIRVLAAALAVPHKAPAPNRRAPGGRARKSASPANRRRSGKRTA